MFSKPPVTTKLASFNYIYYDPKTIDFIPEAHTLFINQQGVYY